MEIGAQTDPFELLDEWLCEARQNPTIKEPTAMTVATGSAENLSARVVLCRKWSKDGLVFFTNYRSRKGLQIERSPYVAAVFYWDQLAKQINISGRVAKTSRAVSEAYWRSRARESQLSQYISAQSQPVDSRLVLERKWKDAEAEFQGRDVPCPTHWGGYLIQPHRIEFWLGRTGRLHDRYLFEKSEDRWTFLRLHP